MVSPLTTQAILGVDFLNEYEVQIDFSSGQLKFGGCNPLALNLRQGTIRGTGVGTVQLSEMVNIPPFSEQVVMAELSGPVPNGVCVFESPKGAKLPCVVARCLVEPKKTNVPIRLLNPSGDTVKIPVNTIVASIESVEALPQEVLAGVAQGTAVLSNEKAEMLEALARDSEGNCPNNSSSNFITCWFNMLGYLLSPN